MLYHITDWYGNTHFMSATAIYLRIMKDSQSDYNWLTSATELVRICRLPGFPTYYAKKIKIAILNCFANLEIQKFSRGYQKDTDTQNVYYCYNSLSNSDADSFEVKKKYLRAVITGVTLYHFDLLSKLQIPTGPTYNKICSSWINSKFNKNISKTEIIFEDFLKDLHEDFENVITQAKYRGAFNKDYEEEKKSRIEIAKLIVEAGKDI